jgi:hypothetical protein
MNLNTLTYRFLTEEDFPKYLDFYDSVQTIMKAPKTTNQREVLIATYNSPTKKNVGVFDEEGEFVAVVSGHYPESFLFWYCHNQYIRTKNNSLSSHIDFIEVFNKSMKMLIEHGEANGYYSFYIRRVLSHQEGHEKLLRLAVKRGVIPDTRYDYLYEAVYGPVSTTNISNHKFFFPDSIEITIDTTSVIVLYTLKQQFRKEILSTKYPNYFSD